MASGPRMALRSFDPSVIVTPERWRRITEIFHGARERDPARREAFVAEACRDDPTLRPEVEAMLAGLDGAGQFGETPLFASASGSEPASSPDVVHLAPGSQLGPYRILSILGAGGMGQVYKAFDPRLHREIAIKIAAERFSERFDREVRAIAALNHPNICTIHDVGPNYLVTELVDGETLRDWFSRALPIERSLDIAKQVLEALRAAHQADIVHRDLKPENVMVRSDGYVKVLDFGLAARMPTSRVLQAESVATTVVTFPPTDDGGSRRLSRPGQILGTIPYMSPEQIQGCEVDQRSDLFAFGILLYEMLTGRHPWPRSSAVDTLHAIVHDDPPPLATISPANSQLGVIVHTLLRKHPAERYPSADAVLDVLALPTGARRLAPAHAPSAQLLTSIAVLPFLFLSDVENNRALSLGFADALISMFANLEDVIVAPTAAIMKYMAGTDGARACRDLGVRYSLQGTVQKLGSHWRVSMQLFDATTQKIMLSETHDFDLQSVFDVQDEVGRRVVESLQRRFPSGVRRSRDRYSSVPEAYNEFIAGLRDSASDSVDTLRAAAEHLSAATERDPEFALAYATLSLVSMNLHFQFDAQHTRLQQADDQCCKALALDPTLPEGHLARAWILWSPAKNFQHAEAIGALQQVLVARPNLERAHNRMSTICLHIGRLEEARIAHEWAQRASSDTRTGNLEWFYLMSGDYARAEETTGAWLRDRPASIYARISHALPALFTGDLDLADERLATASKHHPDEPLIVSLQGILFARRDQPDLALECVRKALDSPRSFGHMHHTYHYIAGVHAVLGDTEKALAWLERSVDTGWACWPFFRIDPHLENLREVPAFKRLIADLEQTYTAIEIDRL